MTILEALEEVNNSLRTPMEFIYADLNEANFNLDSVTDSELPAIVILPITTTDNPGSSGVLKTTFELNAFILKKAVQKTVDFGSAANLETEVIAPMRLLARQFLHKLNEHSIIDPETRGISNANIQPTYSTMDADLHGVYVTASVPVMEGITGCQP